MDYDFRAGKKRVEDILDGCMEVLEQDRLPSIDNLTFTNAYKSWVTAIFVDIRDSTTLMDDDDQEYVAKVVRSFTSEIIEILHSYHDSIEREIGIRGDCVYAVYTTPYQRDIYNIFQLAIWVNTYLNMLNALLRKRGYDPIAAGIGVASSKDHVIKAGRKNKSVNAVVWMGEAVSTAANLSDYGDGEIDDRMVISELTYRNIRDQYEAEYPGNDWFKTSPKLPDGAKHCNIIKKKMNEWIKSGMPDDD